MKTETAVIGTGPNTDIDLQVDPSFNAARVSMRPLEHKDMSGRIGGHFVMSATFTATAAKPAAASQIFSMRWADTGFLYVLKRVVATAGVTTAFGTAQIIDVDIIKATGFSVGASGGTAITLGSTSNRARTNQMNGSLLATAGSMQISSGDLLTAGTQTLDTQPFGYAVLGAATATVGTAFPPVDLFRADVANGVHPMIFSNNEGFAIRNGLANGASGVVKYGFTFYWAEVPAY